MTRETQSVSRLVFTALVTKHWTWNKGVTRPLSEGWLTLVSPSSQAFLLAFLLGEIVQVWSRKWSFSPERILLDFTEYKTLNTTQGTDWGEWHLSLVTCHRLVSCNNPVSLSLVSVELVTICASHHNTGQARQCRAHQHSCCPGAVSTLGDTEIRYETCTLSTLKTF